ncbi:MAG: M24 family metallopeptidase [Nitrospinota bacterium]
MKQTPSLVKKDYFLLRQKKLKQSIREAGLHSILITNLHNIFYLTGFSGSTALALFSATRGYLIVDFRYMTQAKKESYGVEIITTTNQLETFSKLATKRRGKLVGFESSSISHFRSLEFRNAVPSGTLKPTVGVVEKIRIIKDQLEIDTIKSMIKVIAASWSQIKSFITVGAKEREVSAKIEYLLAIEGMDKEAFEYIVASGKRSALPHGVASAKKIRNNELVTIDWGSIKNRLHTDMTRTVAVGQVSNRLRKVYDVVLRANQTAIDAIRLGMTGAEIDEIGRSVIREAGYEKEFGHGLGHGIGIDIHEMPSISPTSKSKVKAGMVFTIEPGIYIPNVGGVRIEDMVLVKEDKVEILTSAISKEYTVVG